MSLPTEKLYTWQPPEGMIIVGSTCYNWGAGL
jgi:hypothetical protein